jgi:hypothetical protein
MKLEKFKLAHEDNNSFHVEHPNGKRLILEKAKLNQKAHEMIKSLKMADGGEVPDFAQNSSQMPPVTEESQAPQQASTAAPSNQDWQGSSGVYRPAPTQSMKEYELGQNATPKDPETPPVNVEAPLEASKAANTAMASAEAGQGRAEKKAIEDTQAQIAALPSQAAIIAANKEKDDKLFQSYSEAKIDPNRYYANMDTGQKIAAGLGMILSGAGGAVSGQGNMAADLIQNAIHRDIEAQKSSKDSKLTLWKMNREALGNDLAANLATQNQLYTGLKYNLMKAASQFRGPEAQARAQAANALIDQQIAQNRFKMSLMNGPSQENRDPAVAARFLIDDPEARHKALAEIGRAGNTRNGAEAIVDSFDRAAKDVRIWSGGRFKNIFPGTESAYVGALHQNLMPTLSDLEGTVKQAAADNLKETVTPHMGNSDKEIAIKREALINYLNSKKDAPFSRGYGIDLDKYNRTKSIPNVTADPVQRITKDGKVALFDPKTKQFMGYQK